jgi:hypothetical protein
MVRTTLREAGFNVERRIPMDTRTFGNIGRLFQPAWLLPLILLAPSLRAQEVNPPRGEFEIGARALAGDRSSSQFNEYRDIRPGLFVEQANFDMEHLFHTN